jgi:mRNA-degrading endonuclease toxin of MazEF toxin-antitoxin module
MKQELNKTGVKMCHQIENINKQRKIIKTNQIENLGL